MPVAKSGGKSRGSGGGLFSGFGLPGFGGFGGLGKGGFGGLGKKLGRGASRGFGNALGGIQDAVGHVQGGLADAAHNLHHVAEGVVAKQKSGLMKMVMRRMGSAPGGSHKKKQLL